MPLTTPSITVATMLAATARSVGLDLELVAGGGGLDRRITIATSQKIGLALTGYDAFLRVGRVLVFGESEIQYLLTLDATSAREAVQRILQHDLPCILLTSGLAAPPALVQEATRAAVPLLRSSIPTPAAIARLNTFLEDRLAPRETLHGVLMDVLGLGVFLVGDSGIGKSECALDLVVRGHRLVADDAVEIRRRAETVLIGTCPELTRHHMEIRGIGVINVRDMFGVASTRRSKRIEFVVMLERWESSVDYERLGLDDVFYDLLGVPVPMVRMPVAPGRNLAILVEVAARNQLLRTRGQHAARQLVARADRALEERDTQVGDDETDEPDDER
ncbi:MAG: HPr(Ser) kinase/phosphatase [Vicinamibacterales bacterium]